VKGYSSGMVVRLACCQTMVEPDILIVDSALAVGDEKFGASALHGWKNLNKGTSYFSSPTPVRRL
jgi:lipopolysaccharide transport system ATP-binding protein